MQLTCLKGYCTSFDILDVAGFFGQITVQNAAAHEKEKKKRGNPHNKKDLSSRQDKSFSLKG